MKTHAFASIAACAAALLGCGSQQLRLSAPDTRAGISYTCTAANTCYPASLASPVEGQPDEALPLIMPAECKGQIHEIVVRNADSSEPEIDVTCAAAQPKPAAKASPESAHDPVDATGIAPLP